MSEQRIKIPRVSDCTIAEVFKQLGEKYEVPHFDVTTLGFIDIGRVIIPNNTNKNWEDLLSQDSYLVDKIAMVIKGLNIVYARGGHYQPPQKSSIYDEVTLEWRSPQAPQKGLTDQQKLDIVSFLIKKLRPFEPERIVGRTFSEEDSQLLAIHQSTLERLEQLNEHLIRQSADFRENLEVRFQESIRKNEEELLKKKEILESELQERRESLQNKYSSKLSKIQIEKQELDEKLKTIDDRNNTHVRREIRDKMLDDVKNRIEQFGVSRATAQKRRPVALGIILLVFCFLGLMLHASYEINIIADQKSGLLTAVSIDIMKASGIKPEEASMVSTSAFDKTYTYLLWIRFTLFSFGLIGTLLYYIKWQNKWAEQHAISEFQLQQFYLDVNRSNWVIESCLEWRKETESSIPKELLTSITNNLFTRSETELERVIHPADELASALMGRASKLKLKIGDSELDFDNPSKIGSKPIVSKSKSEEDE
jgi:hypothetical protein